MAAEPSRRRRQNGREQTADDRRRSASKKRPDPAKRGRPTLYTREVAAGICARMAAGEYLRHICDEDGMPAASTVIGWHLENRDGFSERYTRARESRAELWLEEILTIADDSRNDMMVDDKGNEVVNHDHIQRARLRVDTRKWAMAKVYPRVYGDKVLAEVERRGVFQMIFSKARGTDPLAEKSAMRTVRAIPAEAPASQRDADALEAELVDDVLPGEPPR